MTSHGFATLASGSPAGSQPFANFYERGLINNYSKVTLGLIEESKAYVICPEARGVKRIRYPLSRWHTLPPAAEFLYPP